MPIKNVDLPGNLADFVEQEVATGGYASQSEVVQDAHRLLYRENAAEQEKLEMLRRAGTAGERDAAEAAIGRLKGRLGDGASEAEVELKFAFPDSWSVHLFVALCRKHGLPPYRYPRQRRTTVMVRARQHDFDRIVWPEFSALHTELMVYFEETVDHLIAEALRSDGDDSRIDEPLQLGR